MVKRIRSFSLATLLVVALGPVSAQTLTLDGDRMSIVTTRSGDGSRQVTFQVADESVMMKVSPADAYPRLTEVHVNGRWTATHSGRPATWDESTLVSVGQRVVEMLHDPEGFMSGLSQVPRTIHAMRDYVESQRPEPSFDVELKEDGQVHIQSILTQGLCAALGLGCWECWGAELTVGATMVPTVPACAAAGASGGTLVPADFVCVAGALVLAYTAVDGAGDCWQCLLCVACLENGIDSACDALSAPDDDDDEPEVPDCPDGYVAVQCGAEYCCCELSDPGECL